jgi:hypothetical protein
MLQDDGVAELLDSALKVRVRAVLERRGVTEAELRRLSDEGRTCVLVIGGQLEGSERRLAALAADPASSLTEIADLLRRANELRSGLDELEALLAELEEGARDFRASWAQGLGGR